TTNSSSSYTVGGVVVETGSVDVTSSSDRADVVEVTGGSSSVTVVTTEEDFEYDSGVVSVETSGDIISEEETITTTEVDVSTTEDVVVSSTTEITETVDVEVSTEAVEVKDFVSVSPARSPVNSSKSRSKKHTHAAFSNFASGSGVVAGSVAVSALASGDVVSQASSGAASSDRHSSSRGVSAHVDAKHVSSAPHSRAAVTGETQKQTVVSVKEDKEAVNVQPAQTATRRLGEASVSHSVAHSETQSSPKTGHSIVHSSDRKGKKQITKGKKHSAASTSTHTEASAGAESATEVISSSTAQVDLEFHEVVGSSDAAMIEVDTTKKSAVSSKKNSVDRHSAVSETKRAHKSVVTTKEIVSEVEEKTATIAESTTIAAMEEMVVSEAHKSSSGSTTVSGDATVVTSQEGKKRRAKNKRKQQQAGAVEHEDADASVDVMKTESGVITSTGSEASARAAAAWGEATLSATTSTETKGHHGVAHLTIAFDHVSDSSILQSVLGYASSGTMTAILGSTREGKAALLSILAGYKTIENGSGHVYLNGHKVSVVELRRFVGYCTYQSTHWEASTVREVVTFSALLRQSTEFSESHKVESVDKWLETLEISEIADKHVESCTLEQLLRVKIAKELVARPSVLLLDEPLRGLDDQAVKRIVLLLRKLTSWGYTIIATLNESSPQEGLRSFDRLVLLTRSGEVAFSGELGTDCRHLVKYLHTSTGVKQTPSGKTIALWALECIGASASAAHTSSSAKLAAAKDAKFGKIFSQSEVKRVLVKHMVQSGVTKPAGELPVVRTVTISWWTQMTLLIRRFSISYCRTQLYNRVRMVNGLLHFILFAWIFFAREEAYDTFDAVNSGVQTLFYSSIALGYLSFVNVLYSSSQELVCFQREQAMQMYQSRWYFAAQTCVDVVISFVVSFLFMLVLFIQTGFTAFSVWYWLSLAFYILIQSYIGHCAAYLTKRVDYAVFITLLVKVFIVIATSIGWTFEYFPHRYLMANLVGIVFGDCRVVEDLHEGDTIERDVVVACKPLRFAPAWLTEKSGELTVQSYVEQEHFSTKSEGFMFNALVLFGFFVLFRFVAVFIMHRQQQRVTHYHSSSSSSTTMSTTVGGVTTVRQVSTTTTTSSSSSSSSKTVVKN
ncbi:hypothetical protein Gpo141_00011426, partial [Globisporangium polare]